MARTRARTRSLRLCWLRLDIAATEFAGNERERRPLLTAAADGHVRAQRHVGVAQGRERDAAARLLVGGQQADAEALQNQLLDQLERVDVVRDVGLEAGHGGDRAD